VRTGENAPHNEKEAFMHPIIARTLGGLSREYYFRQFVFGLIFPAITVFAFTHGAHPQPMHSSLIFVLIVNTLLYPYSRFVYEGVVGFVVGENLFIVPAFIMLIVKLLTMVMCWALAIFIAPIGLLYLYSHHSRSAS
jgi:hypothetical protein